MSLFRSPSPHILANWRQALPRCVASDLSASTRDCCGSPIPLHCFSFIGIYAYQYIRIAPSAALSHPPFRRSLSQLVCTKQTNRYLFRFDATRRLPSRAHHLTFPFVTTRSRSPSPPFPSLPYPSPLPHVSPHPTPPPTIISQPRRGYTITTLSQLARIY